MENDNKDVGFIEDSATLIQNAVAAENHAQMSWISTKDDFYLELSDMIRRDRSKLMYSLIPESDAQDYCIVKHTLVMAQNYKELANRCTELKLIDQAKENLEAAGRYEALFRLIRDRKKKNSWFNKLKGGKNKDDVRESTKTTETE